MGVEAQPQRHVFDSENEFAGLGRVDVLFDQRQRCVDFGEREVKAQPVDDEIRAGVSTGTRGGAKSDEPLADEVWILGKSVDGGIPKVSRIRREVDSAPGLLEGRPIRVEKHGHIEYDAEGGAAAAKSPEDLCACRRWQSRLCRPGLQRSCR
jgi:hypothetical protein